MSDEEALSALTTDEGFKAFFGILGLETGVVEDDKFGDVESDDDEDDANDMEEEEEEEEEEEDEEDANDTDDEEEDVVPTRRRLLKRKVADSSEDEDESEPGCEVVIDVDESEPDCEVVIDEDEEEQSGQHTPALQPALQPDSIRSTRSSEKRRRGEVVVPVNYTRFFPKQE
jgi:hypothetical protein